MAFLSLKAAQHPRPIEGSGQLLTSFDEGDISLSSHSAGCHISNPSQDGQ